MLHFFTIADSCAGRSIQCRADVQSLFRHYENAGWQIRFTQINHLSGHPDTLRGRLQERNGCYRLQVGSHEIFDNGIQHIVYDTYSGDFNSSDESVSLEHVWNQHRKICGMRELSGSTIEITCMADGSDSIWLHIDTVTHVLREFVCHRQGKLSVSCQLISQHSAGQSWDRAYFSPKRLRACGKPEDDED